MNCTGTGDVVVTGVTGTVESRIRVGEGTATRVALTVVVLPPDIVNVVV
ncbi:MAG TPA: hypothetical protein VMT44_08265 [Methanoregula sp.]|nr:hypothetical protein [Methanoregula sp.]